MRERALWVGIGGGVLGGVFVVLVMHWARGVLSIPSVPSALSALASLLGMLVACVGWWKWRSAIRSISGTYRHYNQHNNGEFRADKDENRFVLFLPCGPLTISGNLSSGTGKPGTWRTNLWATSLIIEWEGMTIRASKKAEGFFEGYHVKKGKVLKRTRLLKVLEPREKTDTSEGGNQPDEVRCMQVSEKWLRDRDKKNSDQNNKA